MNDDPEPPFIEHDEGEFRRPILIAIWTIRIQVFVLVGIAFVIATVTRLDGGGFDLWNIPFAILALCLMAWCIAPSVPLMDGDGHESARNGFAFRLGKKLKRVLNNRRGNAASGN